MKYNEETYVLDTLKEIKSFINNPKMEQLIRETHENNIMLKEIIRAINAYILNHNNENQNDFCMNVLANLISNNVDFFKK